MMTYVLTCIGVDVVPRANQGRSKSTLENPDVGHAEYMQSFKH
jgi:hypothetical protein